MSYANHVSYVNNTGYVNNMNYVNNMSFVKLFFMNLLKSIIFSQYIRMNLRHEKHKN